MLANTSIVVLIFDLQLKKENAKYDKKLKIFKNLSDEELFRVVEADPRFWLLSGSNSNTPATPRVGSQSSAVMDPVAPDPVTPSTSPTPTSPEISVTPVMLSPSRSDSGLRRSKIAKPYAEAIRSLQEIAKQHSPLQKIKILKQAWIAIYSAVEIYSGGKHKLE